MMLRRCAIGFLLWVAACKKGPAPAAPAPAPPAAAAAADSGCRPLLSTSDKDELGLGLQVCTAPGDSEAEVDVSLRQGDKVLWSERAGSLAAAYIVSTSDPAHVGLQVVIVNEPEQEDPPTYVIDLELADGAVTEVNRFRDSGD